MKKFPVWVSIRSYSYVPPAVAEEVEPRQRSQAEGGDPGERHALLRLRVHEGEPLSTHEVQVGVTTFTCPGG